MLFTIGYAKLQQGPFCDIAKRLGAHVIDVRKFPRSRIRGFGRVQLATCLGVNFYTWLGEELGDPGSPANWQEGLRLLEGAHRCYGVLLLLCQEEDPAGCHRHQIALELEKRGEPVYHIFQDEVIRAVELQRAIEAGCVRSYAHDYLIDYLDSEAAA